MSESVPILPSPTQDTARTVVSYLVAPEALQYIDLMAVLEASVDDLTPGQVLRALIDAGSAAELDLRAVEARLEQLRAWGAATARTDTSGAKRYHDLLARNWRYTATPVGREVQRFFHQRLAGTQLAREIPLNSLQRALTSLAALRTLLSDVPHDLDPDALSDEQALVFAEHTATLFVSHDDLDAALVGAEDTLAGLSDRFDLDHEGTSALKDLLVEYATRVATELSRGSGRAFAALQEMHERCPLLAAVTVRTSLGSELIARGAMTASRGGRAADWEGLLSWFDPATGRAARLSMALVRSVPGMQANLRRLHSSTGTATARSRALAFAAACRDPHLAVDLFAAATGDHPWRKLHGAADEVGVRNPSWASGPVVQVGDILRSTGRTGSRGRPAAARDDEQARTQVAAQRAHREQIRRAAITEVLAMTPTQALSTDAGKLALDALTYTARTSPSGRVRTSRHTRLGLACTLVYTPGTDGFLRTARWSVHLADRTPVFHLFSDRPPIDHLLVRDAIDDPDRRVSLQAVG